MQARVEIFRATKVVGEGPDDFLSSPAGGPSWCRWLIVDSIAFAARQAPSKFPVCVDRMPKALPPLPTTQATCAITDSVCALSGAQKVEVERKRDAALRRKGDKQRQAMSRDEEDPFGLGGCLDE